MDWEWQEVFCFVFLCAMLFCAMCVIACCVYGVVLGALVFAFLFGCGLILLWVEGAFY